MESANSIRLPGRGAQISTANPYSAIRLEEELEQVAGDDEYLSSLGHPATEYFPDESQTIVTENDSPDVGFRYSLNPYRGCSHGCAYCYARPTHEYLGLSAGIDFETKVFVKLRAAELLRDWLARPSWQPEEIVISGVTDCYQPAERRFGVTRACLEVAAECRQPIGIVTKNALVTRDMDQLAQLAEHGAVRVMISVTTLDPALARSMEPRTSAPAARMRAIETLAEAGIPVGVMIAPVIPGLNDSEIPAILSAARTAGATHAGYVMLRLPSTVRPVFLDWLARSLPTHHDKVVSRIRSVRAGRLNDTQFGRRQRGTGPIAEQIERIFRLFVTKLGFAQQPSELNANSFRPPPAADGQLRLF
jgi:DNA repair photolyase